MVKWSLLLTFHLDWLMPMPIFRKQRGRWPIERQYTLYNSMNEVIHKIAENVHHALAGLSVDFGQRQSKNTNTSVGFQTPAVCYVTMEQRWFPKP